MVAVLVLAATLAAAPQTSAPSASLDRIKEALARPPAIDPSVPLPIPVATFRTKVEQRVYVVPLDEWIRQEFKLTALQRQSAEWGSKCCGINVLNVVKGIKRARQRDKARKIREQIARELAALEAARKK